MKIISAKEGIIWVAALFAAAWLGLTILKGLPVRERNAVMPALISGAGCGLGGCSEFDPIVVAPPMFKIYGPALLVGLLFGAFRIRQLSQLGHIWMTGIILLAMSFALAIARLIGSVGAHLVVLTFFAILPALFGSTIGFFHRRLWESVRR